MAFSLPEVFAAASCNFFTGVDHELGVAEVICRAEKRSNKTALMLLQDLMHGVISSYQMRNIFVLLFTEGTIIFEAASSCWTVQILCQVTVTTKMLYLFLSHSTPLNLQLNIFQVTQLNGFEIYNEGEQTFFLERHAFPIQSQMKQHCVQIADDLAVSRELDGYIPAKNVNYTHPHFC